MMEHKYDYPPLLADIIPEQHASYMSIVDRLQPWVRNVPSQVLKSSLDMASTSPRRILSSLLVIESLMDVLDDQPIKVSPCYAVQVRWMAATHLELLPTHGFARTMHQSSVHVFEVSLFLRFGIPLPPYMSLVVHDITLEQVSKDPRHIYIQSWWGSAVVRACHASNDTYDLQVSQFRPFSSSL